VAGTFVRQYKVLKSLSKVNVGVVQLNIFILQQLTDCVCEYI